MLLKVHPENPAPRHIKMIIDVLEHGGVVIFPTDTIYGMGCSIKHIRTVDRIAQIRGEKKAQQNYSFIFHNLSLLSEFTAPLDNYVFKLMKRNLPGPFTFIVEANNNIPKLFHNRKKTVGIRIPDNTVIQAIVEALGHPLLTTSIHDEDEIVEYTTDPELIYEKFGDRVDMVIHAGYGDNEPSTVVDCTEEEPVIVRQGKGILEE